MANELKTLTKICEEIQFRYRVACFNWYKKKKKPVNVHAKYGIFRLPMEIDDSISRWLYTRRHYELDLIQEAMELIRQVKSLPKGKGTLFDIGANNGVISIQMLLSGQIERSVAVEPDPKNFSSLEHNVRQNNLQGRVSCFNCAVSNERGRIEFELSEDNWGDHRVRKANSIDKSCELYSESCRHTIHVECDTLSNLIESMGENVNADTCVVWVDVQGHEGYVFEGGKDFLSRGIPVVSELWPYGIQRSGMSQEKFCSIVQKIWQSFWIKRRTKFVQYPIEIFPTLFDELGDDGDYDTVIFT